jgi:prolyl-tRNA synthetase
MYGKELFRIQDRHEREFCLGPTHEEVITDLVRSSVRSYKNLPVNLYQIQAKFRDEIRPRFGLMRGREFMMKDAYSFHTSEKSLDKEYKNMYETYCRIFERLGLKYRVVEADSGLIGGGFSQEFMVLADTGEEEIFYCNKCDYAASRESAGVGEYRVAAGKNPKAGDKVKEVHTPQAKTIEEVTAFLKAKPEQMIKTLIYETEAGPVAGLVRGDHALNEAKLKKVLGVEDLKLASDKVIEKVTKAPMGFAGPVGLKGVKIVADTAVPLIENGITGANKKDHHSINVSYGRDYKADLVGDLRFALRSDSCVKCGKGKLDVVRGIEVGHIFKLGIKYSAKMNCVYLDENNKEKPMIMGCYGIGIGRTAQAAIEQNNDKDGIVWPIPLAPFQAAIVPANISIKEQSEAADKIYAECRKGGIDVLYDDRDARMGMKLKDIDLIGIPIKLIIGKALKEGKIEIKMRQSAEVKLVPVDKVVEEVKALLS